MPSNSETTASCLTPFGRGAVATVSLCGHLEIADRYFQAANQKKLRQQPLNRINYGVWGDRAHEDLVCVRVAENAAEFHCHGGDAAVQRILNDLENSGATLAPRDQPLVFSKKSLKDEFNLCLQNATTQKTAHYLLRQMEIFPEAIKELLHLPAEKRQQRISEILAWKEFGRHLVQPWKVVLCGPPNVGKSSLVNALVGYSRSVVFDQPGTTRDVVEVQTALGGWPISFADTAGLRQTEEDLEAIGIGKARAHIRSADCLLVVIDAVSGSFPEAEELAATHPNSLIVLNKIDLVAEIERLETVVHVSATRGIGISELSTKIVDSLIPKLPDACQAIPVTEQQVELLNRFANDLKL